MPFQGRDSVPFPDHRRVHRARDPRVRGLSPAMRDVVENGNQVVNAVALTLNRAGSHRRNPILAGLGVELSIPLGLGDDLKGIFLFQNRRYLGSNQKAQASLQAPGVYGYKFLVGSGQSVAGTAQLGPVRNYVRVRTALGAFEKEFWAQDYESDVVTLNGEAALDPLTLEPVEIPAEIVDVAKDWLEVRTDFMVGWADEFLNLHRSETTDAEAGFAKAYGGAAFVSFFDTSTATEGVGVQVNPVNQGAIESRRSIQVQNTAGLKEITARFRSKQDSAYFVDVPLLIRLADQDEVCLAPETLPCTDLYLKAGTDTPEGLPSVPSVPEVLVTEGPDETIPADLLVVTMLGATVGGSPVLRVRKLSWVASPTALVGARLTQVGDDEDHYPLVQSAAIPAPGDPYGSPNKYTVAFSVSDLAADNVAFLELVLVDGAKPGMPVLVPATNARAIQYMPISSGGRGTGGGPTCSGY